MKTIKNIFLVWGIVMLSACNDFLEESSQDLIVPKTVTAFKEFLFGEGLNNGGSFCQFLDIMTDDTDEMIVTNGSRDWRLDFWAYYTWQQDPEIKKDNTFAEGKEWGEYYHRTLIANVILDHIPDMKGDENEKIDLMGEAYFLRAWSYFMLANLYGLPYVDEERAQTDMCVPLNFEVGIEDNTASRATVRQVYDQMESDIILSIAMFKRSGIKKTIFRPNLPTAYLLASRIMLFQKKYDETIAFADSVFKHTEAKMVDLNTYNAVSFYDPKNTEVLFSFGNELVRGYGRANANRAFYVRSASLMKLFGENDKRLDFWFDNNQVPRKFYRSTLFQQAFRLSEAYLNRAEAYAEKNKLSEAAADIRTIRKNRMADGIEIPMGTQALAIEAIRNERRVEFCFEGFRWFDLRRWGCPRIVHTYTSDLDPTDKLTYVLEKNDAAYTLPIPKKERDRNKVIQRWARPERPGSK
ncbi:RagB/SusD family nutrient uptake outer membrane protein [uncultured Sanguibacteroides sp.]|uniref:RagB/SusD family nutrient uptake outer membrane protein n=1 Tax=uncultured Sanguibacteroides sp. TaxID=1635151 RepID=UPI0025F32FC3|nr:RagB/SusD family nutrient uptake outer membrane protein [uncultured Sanguibacteroides sp.]